MTLPQYALDYHNCTREELRAFVKARSREHAEVQTHSKRPESYYVSKLRDLDKSATFRFMDLPPEMRNNVYEYLLVRDASSSRSAFTAVLRTCRQVNREARGIFWVENSIRLRVALPLYDSHSVHGCVEGDLGRINFHTDASRGWKILTGRAMALSSVHRVHVDLYFGPSIGGRKNEEKSRSLLDRFLRVLTECCLGVKHLTVNFAGMRDTQLQGEARLLEPLVDLPKDCTLEFKGLRAQLEADFRRMVHA